MEYNDFQREILDLLEGIEVKCNEPLSKHTSFRIGGPAEVMIFPKNDEELSRALKMSALLDCEYRILGAGTNVLAPDEGVSGLVICLKDCLDGIAVLDNNMLWAAGGVTMSRAAVFAASHGLSGLEFAHGIPGTVGGGVYMNAGAYGGEIAQICTSVNIMTSTGEKKTLAADEMCFGYRHSCLEENGGIVLGATFLLSEKPEEEIRATMQDLIGRRKKSQPLELPSAGSAFKRPVGGYAAALIDQAGLRGFSIGGAAVSEKHAGFVVNCGNATSCDVRELLQKVSDLVFDKFAIRLEPEVRIW